MNIEQLFFELIRISVGTQNNLSHIPSEQEWGKLYMMAKKQSVVGVCFAGLQRLGADADEGFAQIGMGEMQYLIWMGMAAKIQQKNQIVDKQCVVLQKRLSADGFKSCVLKGQSNAANYGTELGMLRQSGDIDLWVDGGIDRIVEYVNMKAPTDEINQHHVQFNVFEDTEVELHFYPLKVNNPWKQKGLDRFCEKQSERQFANAVALGNSQIVAATNEFNLVFQLMHIYHHLFTEGVGLRQLMDYYFVLKTISKSSLDGECRENVKKVISNLGLDRFASALMWVITYVFGHSNISQNLWIPNERDGRFLLEEMMLSGNFGKQDDRQKGLYESKWNSFWMVHMKTFRFWRFDHWAWLWSPVERVNGFLWRKTQGYK